MKRSNQSKLNIVDIFNQAWSELYCPPVRLLLLPEVAKENIPLSPAPFSVLNGTIFIKPEIVPRGCDPVKFLLWYFRHEMAHVHNCPYDMKTAYSLERAAYKVVGDWNLAYLATHIFADLQINLNYLPRRFNELPYIIKIVGRENRSLLDEILEGVYFNLRPSMKPRYKEVAEAGRELVTVMRLNMTWHSKVQMITLILRRLKSKCPKLFSKRKIAKLAIEHPIRIREDFLPNSIKQIGETFGTIFDEEEAREFFKHWLEPRLGGEKKKKMEKMLKKLIKVSREEKKGEQAGSEKKGEEKEEGEGESESSLTRSLKPSSNLIGEEPRLSTSISKAYEKIDSRRIDEAFWKRFWYRSRAEKVIVQYLSESPSRKPVWAVAKYPDQWYVEDDIEDLDVETSLDEGPLIPEVTTLRWIEEPATQGQSLITGFVPSAITVLDSSRSMTKTHDLAATAAFIVHLSAHRAGGRTSVVNFSTNYLSAGWDAPLDFKEFALSLSFDEFTVFPAYEVMRLAHSNMGTCFIVVITDGGWQNLEEAVKLLERIADLGHKIFIFQLPGGDYLDRIKFMKRSSLIRVHKVDRPERDLQSLVLSESIKTYRRYLT